jgi:diguanylate cyclase (GGDEF)-like protein
MKESKEVIFTDEMTKVFNRRFLLERVKEEIGRAEKGRGGFAIVLIDIDQFKSVNESYGHLAGDESLHLFAGFLKDSVRKDDVVCRYEGDVFAVILPEADIKRAIGCGERLVNLLDNKEFPLKTSPAVTLKFSISIGVASYPEDARDVAGLLQNASRALKKAKLKIPSRIAQYKSLEKKKEIPIKLNFERFIGRDDALSLLKTAIEAVPTGKGKAFFVTGQVGIGKTRLLHQAMSYAGLIGFTTFYETAYMQREENPFFLFHSLIEDTTRMFEPQIILQVIKDIEAWKDGLSLFAPDIFGHHSNGEVHLRREKQAVERHLLFESIARFLVEISRYNPLFIFFDDLQWAGRDDMTMLQHIIEHNENSRILIAGAFREDEIDDERNGLQQFMSALSGAGFIETISLSVLSPKEVREMISVALGLWEIPVDIVEFIREITEGNPLFIVEVLKMLIEKGYIYKSGISWNFHKVNEMDLPTRITDILVRKIETLSKATRVLLRAAAVIGEVFTLERISYVIGDEQAHLKEMLLEAGEKGVIVESSDRKGEFRFAYRLMQRVLYGELPEERRRSLHQRVGEMLEEWYGKTDEQLEQRGFHFEKAGLHERALSCFLSSAEEAEKHMSFQKAIAMYTRAMGKLEIVGCQQSALFDIQYKLGNLYTKMGKLRKAEKCFLDSLNLVADDDREGNRIVFLELGRIYAKRGGFDKAMDYFKRAQELLPEDSGLERAMILKDQAEIALKRGKYSEAFSIAQEALSLLGDERIEEHSEILNTLGNANYYWGRLEEAMKCYNKSLHLARKCQDTGRIAISFKNIGQVFLEQGKKWDAERYFKSALEYAQEIGDQFLMGKIYNNLGVLFTPDDIERAKENFMNSLAIKRRIGDDDGVAVILNNMGNLYVRDGELDKALSMFNEALRIWIHMEAPTALVVTYLNIGGIYYLKKNFERSIYYTFKAKEIAKEIQYVNGEISAIIHLAQLLIEEKKPQAVHELVEEAESLNRIYDSEDYRINIALLRSHIAFAEDDLEASTGCFEQIIESVSKITDRNLEKRVEIFGGRLLVKKGNFNEAERYFERAQHICEEMDDLVGLVSVHYFKAVLFASMGDGDGAYRLLLRAKEMLGTHGARLWSTKIDTMLKELDREEPPASAS